MNDFAKFLSINGLKRKDIASFLGVSGAFITQISSGDRPLPEDKLAMILSNAYGWDTSMLTQESSRSRAINLIDTSGLLRGTQPNLRSAIETALNPEEDTLVEYLKAEIKNLQSLISQLQDEKADLLKENAVLEYQLMMYAPKGERTAEDAGGSFCADVEKGLHKKSV